MAFCRITGRSRGLPKPNYFPLLPPISPSAAKRYCRITGKSYGLPSHNFIPVVLTSNLSQRLQCKITTNCSGTIPLTGYDGAEYGQRKHVLLPDYRYLFPRWDDENASQKELLGLLGTSLSEEMANHNYVYRVDEKSCNLVFPAQLECAIREGDVRDVMLAKDSDRVLLKMRQGKNVSVEMCDWRANGDASDPKWATLYDGEGPRPEIILERQREEKQKRRRQRKMRHMAKVFEGNSSALTEQTPVTAKSRTTTALVTSAIESLFRDKQQFLSHVQGNLRSCTDLVKPLIESWDWKTYEQMANSKFDTKVSVDLPRPITVAPLAVHRESVKVAAPELLENTIGFDAIPHVAPLANFKTGNVMSEAVISSIRRMTTEQLADTENAIEKLEALERHEIEELPSVDELPQVLKSLKGKKKLDQLGGVTGLKLDIDKAREIFVPGQNVNTPAGDVFIPGHTVATPAGPVYVPGFTVNTPAGVSFIAGHVTESANGVEGEFDFVAGQIIDDKFVPGQTMGSPTEARFTEGQTVLSADGRFNFIPGIVQDNEFICGQTLKAAGREIFVPGQTITTDDGDLFYAGQSVKQDDSIDWSFVEGQSIEVSEGKVEFVPGKTIKTDEGSKFVPGQSIDGTFVPGIQRVDESDELKFIPGLNIDTEMGPKFIQGMVTESEFGSIFMPGLLEANVKGSYDFAVAKNMNEVVTIDSAVTGGLVIDCNTTEVSESSLLNVFGYMIQTESGGIEFYPEKVRPEHRLAGKAIPGRLFRQQDVTKFIPGIMSDDKQSFIPGQVVSSENGDQFVPGQVVETEDGLKFIPGQVIDTKGGSKFVPGQTFEMADGPRFVPGQIVQTRGGPTFIPGQVIYTEEGGERFVPGQVVDTDDGPRFVPGRVVEKGDSVTFIPGQIVETADGPKFVAPDLLDNEEGEQEFSVQSFLVTPEELKLIKPNGFAAHENGDLSLDTTLLRQLSEAGMSVGRQIEMSAVDLVLQSTKDDQCVRNIGKAFEGVSSEKTVQSSIAALKAVIDCLNGAENATTNLKPKKCSTAVLDAVKVQAVEEVIKRVYTKMNCTKRSFYEVLEDELVAGTAGGDLKLEDICLVLQANPFQLVNKLHQEMEVEQSVKELVNICKKPLEGADRERLLSTLAKAIHDENVSSSLMAMIQFGGDDVIREIATQIRRASEEQGLTHRKLNELVIGQVQEVINRQISALCLDRKSNELNVILTDTIQLAKALEVAPEIINQLIEMRDGESSEVLAKIEKSSSIKELISRTYLLREIITNTPRDDNDEDSENLLEQFRTSPYSIRSNRHFIEAFRKSGSLIVGGTTASALENEPLKSSNELPNQVLFNDNPLVIEDYLLKRKTKTRDALVIIKDTYKAVVPRHLSHAVLTGKCSYTLLDEQGIRHFEPKNVLEALNMTALKRMPTIKKRFSAYQQCKIGPAIDDSKNRSLEKVNGQSSPPAVDDRASSVGEEFENRIADSDEIDGILTMASTCTTFGSLKRYESSHAHSLMYPAEFRAPVGHEIIYPRLITSYRYF